VAPKGEPVDANVHDFIGHQGKAIPYGVYDVAADAGWVSVGRDHDTSTFAVATLRRWWQSMGQSTYPQADRLLICADGGGSNGSRTRLWKVELANLAAETGLEITVCHLPPGTSKWNKIEHRLFSHISMNWRGRALESHEVIVQLLAATTTRSGLTVQAELDEGTYPKDVKISDRQMAELPLERRNFHGDDRDRPPGRPRRRLRRPSRTVPARTTRRRATTSRGVDQQARYPLENLKITGNSVLTGSASTSKNFIVRHLATRESEMAGYRALLVGFVMLAAVTGCGSPEESDVVASPTPVETADPEEAVEPEETFDVEEETVDDPEVEATPETLASGSELTGVVAFEPPAEGEWPRLQGVCAYLDVEGERYLLQTAGQSGEPPQVIVSMDGENLPADAVFVEVLDEDFTEGDVVAREGDTITILVGGVTANDPDGENYGGCAGSSEMLFFSQIVS
jgi:hypothetical protein